jgi:phosphoglycolate phosphatase-like HAD superfamily hydrolase
MDKPIIFDCDGVLVDYVGGFRTFLKEVDGIDTHPEGPREYDMRSWVGTTDMKFVIDRIKRFNTNEGGYFANLKPLPGAVDVVQRLREAGARESVLTQCDTNPATMKARKANLERIFGGFENIQFVDLGGSKKAYLEAHPRSWFIEDNVVNAQLGAKTGHDTLLIEYLHNRERSPDEAFRRVSCWREIHDLLLGAELEATP